MSPSTSGQPPPSGARSLLGAALVGVALSVLAIVVLRRPGWMIEALEAAREAGLAGRLLFALVYVAASLLMLPVTPITVGAGHAFGPVVGALVAAPAACLGSCLAFLLGRTLLHGPVARRVARDRRLSVIAAALRRRGIEVVLLLRLSPLVPFPVLNYVAGVTPVRLRDFAVASFLGALPSTIAFAWFGSLVPDARHAAQGVPLASWEALAALVAITVAGTLLARRALLRAMAEVEAMPAASARRAAPVGAAAAPALGSEDR